MGKNIAKSKKIFYFCDGGSCKKAGSEAVVRNVRAFLRNNDLWDATHTIKTRCNGRCEDAPTCIVQSGNYWYKKLTAEKGLELTKSHLFNDRPIEDYLLYQDHWEEILSENERKPFTIKPFEFKNDTDLGNCLITRGLSSDQYLYPLFLYLTEYPKDVKIEFANNEEIQFKEITEINYSKDYTLELKTESALFELVIGPIPKDNTSIQKEKITVTEYYYQIDEKRAGIRFKNKFGDMIGQILINSIESDAWKYCTKIQLQNTKLKQTLA